MLTYYTGIGSRKTPPQVLETMTLTACMLADARFILRSGGAAGADTAFEEGATAACGMMEIFWPWTNFNDRGNGMVGNLSVALPIAKEVHPNWGRLSHAAKKLHCRNVYQIFGKDFSTPSSVVICWTEGGKLVGGTRTALVLAKHCNIPIINLGAAKYAKLSPEDVYYEAKKLAQVP